MNDPRPLSPLTSQERILNKSPKRLSDLIGQNKIRENLSVLIEVARKRNEVLDHLLFIGSSGLGKATFANIVANEMGVNIKVTSGSAVENGGELAAILTNLRAGDILLIEEIESMRKPVIEVLGSVTEDFSLEINIGKGSSARCITLKLPHFTIIATGSRFPKGVEKQRSIMTLFEFLPYHINELKKIITLRAVQRRIAIDDNSAELLAQYCNGNVGEASFLLEKIHQHALAFNNGNITTEIIKSTMKAYNRKSQ